jgi:transposase InsO family protein
VGALIPAALADRRPGPVAAPHALLSEEREALLTLARSERFVDLSVGQLAAKAQDDGVVHVSRATAYRVLTPAGLVAGDRRRRRPARGKPGIMPMGPREVWSYDITYIPVGEDGEFAYLIAIIDVYSRKIVGWHLSWTMTAREVARAWDMALATEGLLAPDAKTRRAMLKALSDNGTQMKAKSLKAFFRTLDIGQVFGRCRTPEDNAWIESWYATLKTELIYHHEHLTMERLRDLILAFIENYNTRRLHAAIGYVTPEDRHAGRDKAILEARRKAREEARLRRMTRNRQRTSSTSVIPRLPVELKS